MARSHSIWIVRGEYQEIIAAFTVKHECATFLRKYTPLVGWAAPAEILQVLDGVDPTEQQFVVGRTVAEFLEENPPR